LGAPLNNATAPDEYSADQGYLACPGTALVRMWVNNQAIYWQRGIANPGGGGIAWRPEEEYLLPGPYEFPDKVDAIRIRAAVPAAQLGEKRQAQVTIATRTPAELS
jgi:hypothetical protein